ncbi:L-threonylcarbamoyladenylate synthase [Streptomyces mobaraensis]|uniref:L-threonylcarbamoyladenylate synthase n=1 Tax=Streptomyces mobaraensis TaxID=35621 RepID=A0A5N5W1L0_STRMB|nr:Sua5/YciO/YrdC/YwlC family protein [Streptomyces mobaraensis]KAB7835774.1 translation factor SUA5 [Streptomyces mobaraensis]
MDILTPQHIDRAAAMLADGRLVAVPTARWYMLCARADHPSAIEAIFRAKQRPADKPLLLVIDQPARAQQLFQLTGDAHTLMNRLWPGDLALRLPWQPGHNAPAGIGAPALVSCPDKTLGHLVQDARVPLAASAVSISPPHAGTDDHPALTIADVAAFNTRTCAGITAVIDGGICPLAQHMTIVDCPIDAAARMHRPGTVHPRAVAAALTHAGEGVHRVA